MTANITSTLLPACALDGMRIGVSVSETPDLSRLGLLEIHFRLALGEISRSVLVAGGNLSYGGRIDPNGYTDFLVRELQRYHRRDQPLLVTLALPVHSCISNEDLKRLREEFGLYGAIECLNINGEIIRTNSSEEFSPLDFETSTAEELSGAFTAMRKRLNSLCDARVVIGGKREGYKGRMPGVAEEVLLSLKSGKPLFIAGGFGGVAMDLVRILGIDSLDWNPMYSSHNGTIYDDSDWISELLQLKNDHKLQLCENGLDQSEIKQLAVTHRPSEIAALVSLGMGRLLTN